MPKNKFLFIPSSLLGMILLLGVCTSPGYPEGFLSKEAAPERLCKNGMILRVEGAALTRLCNTGILRVGVNPNFEPFSYPRTTQRPGSADEVVDAQVGIDIDIAVLLARELDLDLEIVIPDRFDQLIPMLQSGNIDIAIAALSRVFDRALLVDFSDPYFHTGFSILLNVVKGYRIGIGNSQSYGELKDSLQDVDKESQLVIAVTRSKSAAGFIRNYFPNATVREYDTNEAAAEAVFQGGPAPDSPQIMVHDETFLKLWARKLSRKARQKVVVFPKPFRSDTYGFAVAKGNLAFLQILNLFISDKLIAEQQMGNFTKMRYYRFIAGIGIEPTTQENNDNGNH